MKSRCRIDTQLDFRSLDEPSLSPLNITDGSKLFDKDKMKKLTQVIVSDARRTLETKQKKRNPEFSGRIKKEYFRPVSENEDFSESKLKNRETNSWLRSRHISTLKTKYLFSLEELKKRQHLMAIFDNFDDNGNGRLDLQEFLQMFESCYLSNDTKGKESTIISLASGKLSETALTQEELLPIRAYLRTKFKSYYEYVTHRDYLTQSEFIQLALDARANSHFQEIMLGLLAHLATLNTQPQSTIPLSFVSMIDNLGYISRRNKLYRAWIEKKDDDYPVAFEYLKKMVFLKVKDGVKESEKRKKFGSGRVKMGGGGPGEEGLYMHTFGEFFTKVMAKKKLGGSEDVKDVRTIIEEKKKLKGLERLIKIDYSYLNNSASLVPDFATSRVDLSQKQKDDISSKIKKAAKITHKKTLSETSEELAKLRESGSRSSFKILKKVVLSPRQKYELSLQTNRSIGTNASTDKISTPLDNTRLTSHRQRLNTNHNYKNTYTKRILKPNPILHLDPTLRPNNSSKPPTQNDNFLSILNT